MIAILTISEDDQTLICKIYNKYHKRMLYTATQILGEAYSEDAVHDAFVKIIEKFENNIEVLGDKPGQYFVIIVRNHSLNIINKAQIKTITLNEDLSDNEIFASTMTDPVDALLEKECEDRLVSLIRQMKPTTRRIFEYRYIEGYSNIEIAKILGISQSAVSTRIYKAKENLKEMLESEAAI